MTDFSFVLLYVKDPLASAQFYTDLLGKLPVDASPAFAMLPLSETIMLGLWASATVEPAATAPGGGEVAFTVADAEAVRSAHAKWRKLGLKIAQAPAAMDFGYTFTALDPDGHRLRVFAPGAQA